MVTKNTLIVLLALSLAHESYGMRPRGSDASSSERPSGAYRAPATSQSNIDENGMTVLSLPSTKEEQSPTGFISKANHHNGATRPATSSTAKRNAPVQDIEVISDNVGEVVTCQEENYMPLKLVRLLSRDGSGLSISHNFKSDDPKKQVTVNFPNHFTGCTDLNPKLELNETSNTAVLKVENKALENKNLLSLKKDGKRIFTKGELNRFSPMQKFEQCLMRMGYLVNGELQPPRESGSYSTKFVTRSFDDFDREAPLKLVLGATPGAYDYFGAEFGKADGVDKGASCYTYEDVMPGGLALYDAQDVFNNEVQALCNSNNALAIQNFLDVHGKIQVLEDALIRARKDQMDAAIEDLSKLAKDITKLSEEDDLEAKKELITKYSDKLEVIKDQIIDPSIKMLKETALYREKAPKDEHRAIDAQIADLNEIIGALDNNKPKIKTTSILRFANENGMKGESDTIYEPTRLSKIFKNVYFEQSKRGRGPKTTFKKAEKSATDQISKYFALSREYEKKFEARNHGSKYSQEYYIAAQSTMKTAQKQWSMFQENAKKQYDKACDRHFYIGSYKNEKACQSFMMMYNQQQSSYQRRMQGYNQRYNYAMGQYREFASIEQDFMARQEASRIQDSLADMRLSDMDGFDDYSLFLGDDAAGMYDFSNSNAFFNMPSPTTQFSGQQYMNQGGMQQPMLPMNMPSSGGVQMNPYNAQMPGVMPQMQQPMLIRQ